MEHQLITTRTGYRVCHECQTEKPLDRVHYHSLQATVCRACEFEQTYRTGIVITVSAVDAIASETEQAPAPLPKSGMGGVMHAYDRRSGETTSEERETERVHAGTQPPLTEYQQRTWMLWIRATACIALRYDANTDDYDAACNALWEAMPHEDEWKDRMRHASFASVAEKYIKG